MKTGKLSIIVAISLFLVACQSKPKVIESQPIGTSAGAMDYESPLEQSADHDVTSEEHRVEVQEVLNTEKYTYLNVTENENTFWIAIPRKEVDIGARYYYKGGLLKRHFHSREHNRVFETVYLVSDVLPINEDGSINYHTSIKNQIDASEPMALKTEKGSIKIEELVLNPEKYHGKVVKVTGKCVKVNPMIMDRNWIHVQDGSGDNLDLTVTTNENILLGTVVSLEGTIALNKDFGAGYRYDIIMEGAVLK